MKNHDQMLYWAPQKKLGGGWICFKDSPSPPPAPDYTAAAKATSEGNIDAARAAAAANRVNQVTPYGSLTYTHAPQQFDQAGYDAAMADYNRQLQAYSASGAAPNQLAGGALMRKVFATPTGSQASAISGNAPVAPDRNAFMSGSPDDGWTATQTLSPAQQQLLDQQNKTSLGLAGLADQGLGYVKDALANNITAADLPADMVNAGQTGQDALMARFQPMIDQQHKALESQLANQGITLGSEAYNNAMRTQNQSENDLRMQAALNGIGVGQNAQNQRLALLTALKNQPLNMLNAVRTGAQVTNPTFANVPMQATTAGPDLMGAASAQHQSAMGLYNSQVAGDNSMMGGLMGLGAAALMSPAGTFSGIGKMFSDVRLKTNIKRIGTHDSGVGIYSYIKFGKPEIGVIAQEFEQVKPEAVTTHASGYKMIDIGAL